MKLTGTGDATPAMRAGSICWFADIFIVVCNVSFVANSEFMPIPELLLGTNFTSD
jgi:hypothetical protein